MEAEFDTEKLFWIFEPKNYSISKEEIRITTEPNTDFWQRTYYGFRNDNAHSILLKTDEKFFSFIVKASFDYKNMYDQCGIVIYQNSDNWVKASVEYENDSFQRLGSVVTNNGYSDWATTDINSSIAQVYYRLSRRKSDFLIESSFDGKDFEQMRVFHLFEGGGEIDFGLYACSPLDSSFEAVFSGFEVMNCTWEKHG